MNFHMEVKKTKLNDLTGKRFGKLVVIKRAENQGNNRQWFCKCDCGTEKIIGGRHLTSGNTVSCGCYRHEIKSHYIHGQRGTRLYGVWSNIINRCQNPNYRKYCDYGGRGVNICDEWRNDYMAFFLYVSALPHFNEPGYSIDRIDNSGNYEPGNVRWATASQQAVNRRKSTRQRDGLGRWASSKNTSLEAHE